MKALAEPIRAAAYQASDALHRFVRRNEEAQGGDVIAGQASAPPTATSEDTLAQRTQAAQAEFNEPIPQAPTAVDTPAQPPSQAPREGFPVALPQQRVVQASDPAPAIRKKSPTPAPVKQASTPSRPATDLARAPSAKAPTAWYAAQNRSSTQARRA